MSILNSNENRKIVLFSLDEPRYALYLSTVERVVRAVEITPLPKAPDIVLGVINFQGDIRDRFHLPGRERDLEDQFIIAHTSKRLVVLAVDSVAGVYEIDTPQIVEVEGAFPYTDYISGIAKVDTRIILITDLEKFLSLDEEIILNKALTGEAE